MRNALLVLAIGFLLFGCIVQEERRAEIVPGENASPPAQEPQQPGETPALNESALPEPTEASPEVNISVERMETEVENVTEKEYFGIEFDGYTLLLEDLAPQGAGYCALIKIVKINGTMMQEFDRAQICPGESHYWVSPGMHRYRIKVIETAAGYSNNVAWANIIVYS
ncbi:MAG: hypothetical protein AB1657_03105 [Candidatus Micrarchaeota archaeon]